MPTPSPSTSHHTPCAALMNAVPPRAKLFDAVEDVLFYACHANVMDGPAGDLAAPLDRTVVQVLLPGHAGRPGGQHAMTAPVVQKLLAAHSATRQRVTDEHMYTITRDGHRMGRGPFACKAVRLSIRPGQLGGLVPEASLSSWVARPRTTQCVLAGSSAAAAGAMIHRGNSGRAAPRLLPRDQQEAPHSGRHRELY
jgi:hypothetical protein